MFWSTKIEGFSICFGLKKVKGFLFMFWSTKMEGFSICFGLKKDRFSLCFGVSG